MGHMVRGGGEGSGVRIWVAREGSITAVSGYYSTMSQLAKKYLMQPNG